MSAATLTARETSAQSGHYIARARALRPILQAAAQKIETTCEAPPEVLEAMYDAGMFRLLLPGAFGGAELRPADYIQCVEAIAMGDASVAWCMNQGSGCSMSAAYLVPEVAAEVFGPRNAVLAWGQLRGSKAYVVDGGYRVTGAWAFVSGGRHATWIGGHCHVVERDGSIRCGPDGSPIERTMLLPKAVMTMRNDWQVIGLRGTGSDTFAVEDVFVADDHSLCRDTEEERRETGTLYRFATTNMYAAGFAAVGLGVARAMLDDFVELARAKTPSMAGMPLRDNARVQFNVALSEVRLTSARNHLIQILRDAWDAVTVAHPMTMEDRVRIRAAATYAIHTARDVTEMVWSESGATAIFEANPFERRYRDMHTVTQQAQGRSAHLEAVGKWMLGGDPSLRFI